MPSQLSKYKATPKRAAKPKKKVKSKSAKNFKWDGTSRPVTDAYRKNWKEIFSEQRLNLYCYCYGFGIHGPCFGMDVIYIMKFRELKEEAYQRLHELQLKKNHPLTWGSSSDRKIDKEMDEIFKNSENFLGDD